MISFDFEYYRPDTIEEAINLFNKLTFAGKKPIYYGGGTEFISMARMNNIYTEAVIDIKGVPECNIQEIIDNELIIGSAVTLTNIAEANYFPLLSLTVKRIADHTIQGKITLGGNIAGTIIYKEAVLPLLVADSEIVIANKQGKRRIPLKEIYDNGLQISQDDLILQVIIKDRFLTLPYLHVKRTKNEKIDYPLITIAALKDDNNMKFAFSGLCEYPFRSYEMENILNNNSISEVERINDAIHNIPGEILNDLSGSSEYRKFMLHTILSEALERFQEVK